jgi:hypothetical protein
LFHFGHQCSCRFEINQEFTLPYNGTFWVYIFKTLEQRTGILNKRRCWISGRLVRLRVKIWYVHSVLGFRYRRSGFISACNVNNASDGWIIPRQQYTWIVDNVLAAQQASSLGETL